MTKEARGRDLDRPEERVAAVNAVLPHLARLDSPIERASWAGRLADALRIEDDLVLQELQGVLKSGRTNIRHRVREAEPPREVESRLVSLLLRFEEGRDKARADLEQGDLLVGTRVSGIVRALWRLVDEGKGVDYPTLFSALDDDDKEILTHIAFRDEPEAKAEEMEDCIRALHRQRLMRERRELQKRIQTAADAAAIDTLLDRTQQLARQIDALS